MIKNTGFDSVYINKTYYSIFFYKNYLQINYSLNDELILYIYYLLIPFIF
jgi:hypothetical protein